MNWECSKRRHQKCFNGSGTWLKFKWNLSWARNWNWIMKASDVWEDGESLLDTPVVASRAILRTSFIISHKFTDWMEGRQDAGIRLRWSLVVCFFRARNRRASPRWHNWKRNHDQSEELLWIPSSYFTTMNELMNEFSFSLSLLSSLSHLFFIQEISTRCTFPFLLREANCSQGGEDEAHKKKTDTSVKSEKTADSLIKLNRWKGKEKSYARHGGEEEVKRFSRSKKTFTASK